VDRQNGDPANGETNTATVMPVKDMIIVGISGGEFGVRGHLTAYDMASGEQLWRAYSTGPDEECSSIRATPTVLGEPIGENSSLDSWEGDQWQIGGGTTWGWYSYDPELDLIYYGTGNPRPGTRRSARATTSGP
jgi:glucose dehydrogenase